jgi:hypothetical protein
MTPEQCRLARSRLRLGITNVGFWVLTAIVGLRWLANRETIGPDFFTIALLFAMAIAVQAAFDFVGGVILVPYPRPTPMGFVRIWLPAFFGHTLVLAVVGILSAMSLRITGGFGLGILFATGGLSIGRRHLLRIIGGVETKERTQNSEAIFVATVDDPAFTGGIVGLGRAARSLLPNRWIDALPESDLRVELIRRRWQIANGLPGRAFVGILLWNLLGAFIGTQLFHFNLRTPTPALLGHACWMTLWTFVSLLVLPVLSRKSVFAADRAVADLGHDPRGWIALFPHLVGEDGSRNAAVQSIFYPVPSAAMRLNQLGHPAADFGPGNLARSNLYYSWATLTLLGRAVHCNLGRPALWVFPPSA